jgi:hypothetical protein
MLEEVGVPESTVVPTRTFPEVEAIDELLESGHGTPFVVGDRRQEKDAGPMRVIDDRGYPSSALSDTVGRYHFLPPI